MRCERRPVWSATSDARNTARARGGGGGGGGAARRQQIRGAGTATSARAAHLAQLLERPRDDRDGRARLDRAVRVVHLPALLPRALLDRERVDKAAARDL
eukprot:5313144-Prymnesium_polylepis.1